MMQIITSPGVIMQAAACSEPEAARIACGDLAGKNLQFFNRPVKKL